VLLFVVQLLLFPVPGLVVPYLKALDFVVTTNPFLFIPSFFFRIILPVF